jgi:hypothetical protein
MEGIRHLVDLSIESRYDECEYDLFRSSNGRWFYPVPLWSNFHDFLAVTVIFLRIIGDSKPNYVTHEANRL